eukprot:TRINITY_DN105264_c0_g1_i1.p1 TRINITY_DN105264_c0_g1~~TRINITY_DN105264_c0_g1_i1.p1  ORF type:complete len:220 (-),score=43.66 TRINITY_DN105264_c0_g1_i1:85-744(-)
MAAAAPVMVDGMTHGSSPLIMSEDKLYGMMEWQDFAPSPCVCCGCTIPQSQKDRTYLKVFDNRIEFNFPMAPFGCLTCDEKCITDRTGLIFHDRSPSRIGMCCYVIPCTCCGPPVLFASQPKMCCGMIDLTSCYGEALMAAPSSYFGLKVCVCCGGPCYTCCAYPLAGSTKNTEQFLLTWKSSLLEYWRKNNLEPSEMAIFEVVSDVDFGLDKSKKATE